MTRVEAASANDDTRAVADTARGSKQEIRAGSGGAIRRLFRQAVKVLTDRPAATPKKSRRRSGDGRNRQFRRLARKIMRRHANDAGSTPWLTDTLDWLHFWQHGPCISAAPTDEPAVPNNHLSPRL